MYIYIYIEREIEREREREREMYTHMLREPLLASARGERSKPPGSSFDTGPLRQDPASLSYTSGLR